MDLNRPPPPYELNIWFTLQDINFTICTKLSTRLRLVGLFEDETFQRILQNPQQLLLAEVGPTFIGILMLV
jgi:hypothetical protein